MMSGNGDFEIRGISMTHTDNYFLREVIDARWERQGKSENVAICLGCLKTLYKKNRGAVEENKNGVWHECYIIPVKDGGDNTLDNCGILCKECNTIYSDDSNEIDTIEKLREYKSKEFNKKVKKGVIPPAIPPGHHRK